MLDRSWLSPCQSLMNEKKIEIDRILAFLTYSTDCVFLSFSWSLCFLSISFHFLHCKSKINIRQKKDSIPESFTSSTDCVFLSFSSSSCFFCFASSSALALLWTWACRSSTACCRLSADAAFLLSSSVSSFSFVSSSSSFRSFCKHRNKRNLKDIHV